MLPPTSGTGSASCDTARQHGADRCGEVTDSRYTKATGMAEILRRFDAPQSATIAFGDGDNDLEMMDFASFGVAMATELRLCARPPIW